MKTIVLCNQLDQVRRIAETTEQPLSFLCLQSPLENLDARDFLRSAPNCTELPIRRLVTDLNNEFRKNFIEFMGRANLINHSPEWWAMPFTNKNAMTGSLCRNLYQFQMVVNAAVSHPFLVVLSCNRELGEQAKRWGNSSGVSVTTAIKIKTSPKELIRRILPAGAAKSIITTIISWVSSRRLRLNRNLSDQHFLVATHTHSRSFLDQKTYKDAYFGPLINNLVESGQNPIVVGLPYEQPFQQLKEMARLRERFPVVPVDSCLTFFNILTCSVRAFMAYWHPPKVQRTIYFSGMDVSYLLGKAVREGTRSGDFFSNLRIFYGIRWLSRQVNFRRCIYPFENRSWEKMLVLGMTEGSPETRMVGYQHTSVTPHHANFFMADGEAEITPLPHAIVTCGDVTQECISGEGNFPYGMVTSACALRQTFEQNPLHIAEKRRDNSLIKSLLVILATGEEEYALTSQFLTAALKNNNRFQVCLRPHPNLPTLELPQIAGASVSTGNLHDDLQRADALLYASSTVSMEAIALGIPAIFLDLGVFLNTDPMFGWNEFKWEVSEPSQLVKTIETIESIPQDQFQKLRQRGLDYVYSYLKPVTPANMQPFLDA